MAAGSVYCDLRSGIQVQLMNRYLRCKYEDGARGPDKFDCWGLVRHIRHYDLGFRLLPEFGGLRNTDPRGFTRAYEAESALMERCEPEHGAIAAVLIGRTCVHVALIYTDQDRLMVIEINPERGARRLPLSSWLRGHNTVTFHRDAK